ncbi:MAG: sigma-70 family RNA polymerase sigma factor [Bacteroidaceae bacterium]|nr:sigma-70 family RNA polymerase sigma factor [Bacteroidaceae bacterium]
MEDREIVREIVEQGRTGLFTEIVKRYSGLVYSKALGVVRREDLAADVTQTTFVKAYEQLAFWRGERLGPWLVTISMHTALHTLEKEKVRRAQPVDNIADNIPETFDEEREEMILRMETAIKQLPSGEQELIKLHYYQKEKTADIARKTGLSQQNVLVKLHRIREKLKSTLTTMNCALVISVGVTLA